MNPVRVRIFYPADPLGVVPGGIDTFLRGVIKCAPSDLEFSLVGMTTDRQARPEGKWTRCRIDQREFDFFPVVSVDDAGGRGRIPLSVRFSLGLRKYRSIVGADFDVFDFHRPEPALIFRADRRPKSVYFHNDPQTIRSTQSDNLWRRLPAIYERLEQLLFKSFDAVWCVRESGVRTLQQRYPAQAQNIRFIPTWVDGEHFYPVDAAARSVLRRQLAVDHDLDEAAAWVISVGRLDTQKDPQLMLQAFARQCAAGRKLELLFVGDGVLRSGLEQEAVKLGIGQHVHFLGLRAPSEIAGFLRAADVFALSSAYEGMPMALLEALGSGLPAVVTDVGEVRRVVQPGVNGEIAPAGNLSAFSEALGRVVEMNEVWRGEPAIRAVDEYRPEKVLAVAYDSCRRLGADFLRIRQRAQQAAGDAGRRRGMVVGVPIDALDAEMASQRILSWAGKRESRAVAFVNVHSAIHAGHDESHREALQAADLVAPDGAPIAWSLRFKGFRGQQRVDGPGMMWRLCSEAAAAGINIGLYGSTPQTLQALEQRLGQEFPALKVAYVHSPPFRALSAEEEAEVCRAVEAAQLGLLFVSLGCPKQELWIARQQGRIPAVMLGVGAAFEFHAGTVARAPAWVRENGLEWLHRLLSQPRRLWRRYLFSNSLFLGRSVREVILGTARRLPLVRRLLKPSLPKAR